MLEIAMAALQIIQSRLLTKNIENLMVLSFPVLLTNFESTASFQGKSLVQ